MERHKYNPVSEFHNEKPTIAIVDISSMAESQARDVANEKSTESTEKPKGFWNKVKNFGKTIWKRSELSQTIERYKAEKEIRKSGNLFINEKDNGQTQEEKKQIEKSAKEAHEATVKAITERFSKKKEFEKEFIHTGAGEHREELQDGDLKKQIIKLVKDYAKGSLNEDEFQAAKNEILEKKVASGVSKQAIDKGKLYADNIFEVAKWAKDYVRKQVEQGLDHALAVEQLDQHFQVVVGKARDAVRTEAQLNAIDRITNVIQKYTGGALNEGTVAVGVATVYGTAGKIVEGSLKKAAAVFGAGMAASGAVGALRESRKLEMEKAQHAREIAQGKKVKGEPTKAERRQELEQSRIQFKEAGKIEAELNSQLFSKEVSELTETEFQLAMQTLADLEARVNVSDWGIGDTGWLNKKNKYSVDLIGYSDVTKKAEEQAKLDVLRARAKIKLKQYAEAKGLNFDASFNETLNNTTNNLFSSEKGINAQTERFRQMKKEKVKKAFWKSALLSGAIGVAVQEARAYFDNDIEGLAERGINFVKNKPHIPVVGERTTLAEGLNRRGQELYEQILSGIKPKLPLHDVILGANKFKLEDGINFQPDSGTVDPNDYYLVDKAGNKISGSLKLNPDGSLTTDAKKWLTDHGFAFHETAGTKTLGGIHNLNEAETLKKFPGLKHNIREDWHDEPGEFWSDIHGKMVEFEGTQQMGYLEKHGDKVYLNASKVAENFLKNITDQIDAATGNTMPGFGEVEGYKDGAGNTLVAEKLKHLRKEIEDSVNDGTFFKHFQAVVIPTEGANKAGISDLIQGADSDGKINLGPDWSKYFTKPEHLRDGHLPFKFLELRFDGHTMGTARGFSEEIVSTPITEIITPGKNGVPFEVVPPIPMYVRGRRPGLEEMEGGSVVAKAPDSKSPEIVYGGYGRENQELRNIFRERMSPSLREDPQAVLDFEKEIDWYLENHVENNVDYLKDINQILRQPGMRERMANECRAVSCIPVYTLGEGKGIQHTLEQYRKQIENGTVKPEEFELILFLNHPKDKLLKLQQDLAAQGKTMDGAEQRVRAGIPEAYDTEEVIKQYKQQHPEMKIRVMSKEFETRPQWGWIIKYAYDAACIRAGARRRPVNKDFLILTNDADLRDMSDSYMRTMIDEFDKNEAAFASGSEVRLDGFVGRIDHDNETYKNWPNFFLSTRFDQFLDAQNRYGYKDNEAPYVDPTSGYLVINKRNGEKQVITQGRSTAIRGSTYCAVGGARVEKDAGADTELGDMVRNGRRGVDSILPKDRNPFKYENKIWLETDPRRELGMYKKGFPIRSAWENWDQMDVYGKTFAEQIEGDQEVLSVDRLQREFYEATQKWWVSPDSAEMQRALAWLGLAGIETNDNGEPIDSAGNVITDVTDSSKLVKYKDYEIGEIEIKNGDGSVRKVRGIKILSLAHLNKKVAAWKPKRERVENAKNRAKQENLSVSEDSENKDQEQFNAVQEELDQIVKLSEDDDMDDAEAVAQIAVRIDRATKAGKALGDEKLSNFMNNYLAPLLSNERVNTRFLPAIEKYAENKERKKQENLTSLKKSAELVYRVAMNDTLTDRRASENILRVLKSVEKYRDGLTPGEISESMKVLKTIPLDIWNRRVSPSSREMEKSVDYPSYDRIRKNIEAKWGINKVHYELNGVSPADAEIVMANLSKTFIKAKASSLRTQVFNKIFSGKTQAGLHIRFAHKGEKIGRKNGELILPIDANQEEIQNILEKSYKVEFKNEKAPVVVNKKSKTLGTRRRGR